MSYDLHRDLAHSKDKTNICLIMLICLTTMIGSQEKRIYPDCIKSKVEKYICYGEDFVVNSTKPMMMSLFSVRVFSLPHFTFNDVAHGTLLISVCTHMSGWSHLDSCIESSILQMPSVCTRFPNLYLPRVLSQTCSHVSNSTPLLFTWIFKMHQGKIHDTIVNVLV